MALYWSVFHEFNLCMLDNRLQPFQFWFPLSTDLMKLKIYNYDISCWSFSGLTAEGADITL